MLVELSDHLLERGIVPLICNKGNGDISYYNDTSLVFRHHVKDLNRIKLIEYILNAIPTKSDIHAMKIGTMSTEMMFNEEGDKCVGVVDGNINYVQHVLAFRQMALSKNDNKTYTFIRSTKTGHEAGILHSLGHKYDGFNVYCF